MASVLVAEDDLDAAVLMQLVLQRGGHTVRMVHSGQDVLDACSQEVPDVILLDVTLPGMDGFEVMRALKSRTDTCDVPVLFVTGSTDTRQKVAGLALGANDYITKPFRRDELLARVEVALRIKREAENLRHSNAQLTALSMTDSLTGVYNRRYLDQRLEEEVARSHRHGYALSCLMIDIDHFKRVNDRYGHQEGDRVLQAIGTVIRQAVRISDVVGRYGGEEFTVIAPSTSLLSAMVVGERIRTRVEQCEFRIADDTVHVTVSIGVAELTPSGSAQSLIAAADRALYLAKTAGRNRVVADRQV